MHDIIVKVSGHYKWLDKTTTLTLMIDYAYWPTGAMGTWNIARGTNDHGNGGENTDHARWFRDLYEKTCSLQVGWYDGDTRITEVFTLFQVEELTIGKYGFGNFYYGGEKTPTNIQWEVIQHLPPSPRVRKK